MPSWYSRRHRGLAMGPEEFIALDVVGYTLSAMTTVQAPVHDHGTFAFTVGDVARSDLSGSVQHKFSLKFLAEFWRSICVSSRLDYAQVSDPGPAGVQRYYRIITLPSTGAKPQAAVARSLAAVPGSHLRGTALARALSSPCILAEQSAGRPRQPCACSAVRHRGRL